MSEKDKMDLEGVYADMYEDNPPVGDDVQGQVVSIKASLNDAHADEAGGISEDEVIPLSAEAQLANVVRSISEEYGFPIEEIKSAAESYYYVEEALVKNFKDAANDKKMVEKAIQEQMRLNDYRLIEGFARTASEGIATFTMSHGKEFSYAAMVANKKTYHLIYKSAAEIGDIEAAPPKHNSGAMTKEMMSAYIIEATQGLLGDLCNISSPLEGFTPKDIQNGLIAHDTDNIFYNYLLHFGAINKREYDDDVFLSFAHDIKEEELLFDDIFYF